MSTPWVLALNVLKIPPHVKHVATVLVIFTAALSERRRYCEARRLCVCHVRRAATLASAAKVMRHIQCSLVKYCCQFASFCVLNTNSLQGSVAAYLSWWHNDYTVLQTYC